MDSDMGKVPCALLRRGRDSPYRCCRCPSLWISGANNQKSQEVKSLMPSVGRESQQLSDVLGRYKKLWALLAVVCCGGKSAVVYCRKCNQADWILYKSISYPVLQGRAFVSFCTERTNPVFKTFTLCIGIVYFGVYIKREKKNGHQQGTYHLITRRHSETAKLISIVCLIWSYKNCDNEHKQA